MIRVNKTQKGISKLLVGEYSTVADISPVNGEKSLLIASVLGANSLDPSDYNVLWHLDVENNQIVIERGKSGNEVEIFYKLMEFTPESNITFQRGVEDIGLAYETPITLSRIGLNNSFPILSCKSDIHMHPAYCQFRGYFSNNYTLILHNPLVNEYAKVAWQVASCPDFFVQQRTGITSTITDNVPVVSTTPNKTMLQASWCSPSLAAYEPKAFFQTSEINLCIEGYVNAGSIYYALHTVYHKEFDIDKGLEVFFSPPSPITDYTDYEQAVTKLPIQYNTQGAVDTLANNAKDFTFRIEETNPLYFGLLRTSSFAQAKVPWEVLRFTALFFGQNPGDEIFDYVQRAKDLLIEQFQQKESIEKIITILVEECQNIETVLEQINRLKDLDSQTGVQLDIIGSFVGEDRLFRQDEEYREAIRLRISLNKSNGEYFNVVAALKSLIQETSDIHFFDAFPAQYQIDFKTFHTLPADLQQKMEDISGGGIEVILSYIQEGKFFALDEEDSILPNLNDVEGLGEDGVGNELIGGQLAEEI